MLTYTDLRLEIPIDANQIDQLHARAIAIAGEPTQFLTTVSRQILVWDDLSTEQVQQLQTLGLKFTCIYEWSAA